MADSFDLIVIGAGPGGYVAAIRAAQLGLKTAVVEREPKLGGTCLRVGCIPSKALLETTEQYENARLHFSGRGIRVSDVQVDVSEMMQHKDGVVARLDQGIHGLLKKNKIQRLAGQGRLLGQGRIEVSGRDGTTAEYSAKRILIATGSIPSAFPGMEPDGDRIGTSTEALAWSEVPERLVVIGAGVIGLELGTVWRRLGSHVTILEYLPRILPGADSQVSAEVQKLMQKQGLEFRLGTRVQKVTSDGRQCRIEIDGADPVTCDRVLIAVGRRPCTQGLGLEAAGVQTDERGFIQVSSSYQTTAPGVFAVGDVIGGAMLAHKAEEEGIACVEKMVTGWGHVNYRAIPSVIYTQPEVAWVGETEDALREDGQKIKVGRFSFAANGRAVASGHTAGFVKIIGDQETDRLLGVHVIGPHAGELIAECTAAIEFRASCEDLARCCHAHPTLSEAIKEAALAVDRRAIHS